jgi:hypothetical protein
MMRAKLERSMRVLRGSVLLAVLWTLASVGDARALTLSGQVGDGDFDTFQRFEYADGFVRLRNASLGSWPITAGEYSLYPHNGPSYWFDPATPATSGSGALTFIYENTLTLNGVTETFARTIDVTWGSPTYGGTEVIFHRVLMEFDLGADGVLAVEFPEEIYRSGSATIVGGLKIAVIPEPSTAMLVAGGLLALGLRRGSL